MTDVPMDEASGEPITPDDAAIGGVPTSSDGSLATDSGLTDAATPGADDESDDAGEASRTVEHDDRTDEAGSDDAADLTTDEAGETAAADVESPVERGL